MIHTASLVHDDVLDECDLRRGAATVNSKYGTRLAVLAGDYLFAQVCVRSHVHNTTTNTPSASELKPVWMLSSHGGSPREACPAKCMCVRLAPVLRREAFRGRRKRARMTCTRTLRRARSSCVAHVAQPTHFR